MARIILAAAALVLTLAGCSSPSPDQAAPEQAAPTQEPALLADHDLAGMDTVEVIDHLDRLGGDERPTDLMASVRAEELLLTDGEEELALDIPEDRFYLSVAPYVSRTHECYYHSLTTCQGELVAEEVQVTVTDDAGEVVVEEQVTTFANGFVGLWLPRDLEGTLRVDYQGLTGEVDIATGAEDPTCLTTLKVA